MVFVMSEMVLLTFNLQYNYVIVSVETFTHLGIYWKSRNGNELEIENENWKQNKKRTNHQCSVFFMVCLVISCIVLSNGYSYD